jgi:hypothetical protein
MTSAWSTIANLDPYQVIYALKSLLPGLNGLLRGGLAARGDRKAVLMLSAV